MAKLVVALLVAVASADNGFYECLPGITPYIGGEPLEKHMTARWIVTTDKLRELTLFVAPKLFTIPT